MRRSLLALILFGFASAAIGVHAQEAYPTRPIRIIVPLAAGGGTDVLARVIAQKLSAKLGQPVTVENRTGAAGNIGAEAVFRAQPDGYTLLFTQPAPLAVNKALYAKLPFEPEQFVPIALVSLQDILLAMNPKVPAKNLQELIAYAKANPGKLNYGSSGAGSTPHLAAEHFKALAKVEMVHVPYKGHAESMNATLGGQVDLTFFAFGSAIPMTNAGKLRAVAVGGSKRNALLPDTPSISEALPGFIATSWTAMVAPPGTPPHIAKKLQDAMAEVRKMPDVQAPLLETGDQVFDSTPAQMAAFLQQETRRFSDLIKAAGIKAQ